MFENDLFGRRSTLMGIRVIESPYVQPVPRIQVRDIKLKDGTSILTEQFRAEMNAWFLERFGTMNVAYVFQGSAGPSVAINPRDAVMLRDYL